MTKILNLRLNCWKLEHIKCLQYIENKGPQRSKVQENIEENTKRMQTKSQYQQGNTTINSLQNYITELTIYINENNAKYTKNLQTLKNFYEQQIHQLQCRNNQLQDQTLSMKNQLITCKDVLNNRQKELKEIKSDRQQFRQENEELRQKLYKERQKIDELYEEMVRNKKEFQKQLDSQQKRIKLSQEQKGDLVLKLKEKDQDIGTYRKQISKLEHQLSQRYSLPEKLKDIQIQSTRNKTLVQSLTQTKKQLEKKIDYLQNETESLRRQNKRLEIANQGYLQKIKNQINEAVNKEKQKTTHKIKNLQSLNEKKSFQMTELQNAIKNLKKQNNQFEAKTKEYQDENSRLKGKLSGYDEEKEKYFAEFQKLKKQYQDVIKNLQDSIPKYQKKNWTLQQQNIDLNQQLQGLRDLLNEVRAMNSLQPLKAEYRKVAEMELLAHKEYKQYKDRSSPNNLKAQKQQKSQDAEYDQKWGQLLAQIDNITI